MTRLTQFTLMMLAGALVLVGCSPAGPVRTFRVGEEIAANDFSEPDTFEEGAYNAASLSIDDGVYRIRLEQGDNELWWGQWGDTLADVVIDVEVQQTSERNENAFGVGCRMAGTVGQVMEVDPTLAAIASGEGAEATAEATLEITEAVDEEATETADEEATEAATAEVTEAAAEQTEEADETPEATEAATAEATEEADEEASEEDENVPNGNGYLFLIQGNGQYAIMRASGRDVQPLVEWTQSDRILQGQEVNELRAVCVGDYLALYINGEFVAGATDDTYSEGQVGLMASAATRLGVNIEFDNLVISEALAGDA